MFDYKELLDQLTAESTVWYEEYSDWAHSARGVLEMVQQYTGNITEGAAKLLSSTAQESGVQELLEVADEWGMTRGTLKEARIANKENNIVNAESMFQQE